MLLALACLFIDSTVNHTLRNVECKDGVLKHVMLQGPLGGRGMYML